MMTDLLDCDSGAISVRDSFLGVHRYEMPYVGEDNQPRRIVIEEPLHSTWLGEVDLPTSLSALNAGS
jgi:hypothetical protein